MANPQGMFHKCLSHRCLQPVECKANNDPANNCIIFLLNTVNLQKVLLLVLSIKKKQSKSKCKEFWKIIYTSTHTCTDAHRHTHTCARAHPLIWTTKIVKSLTFKIKAIIDYSHVHRFFFKDNLPPYNSAICFALHVLIKHTCII